MAAAVIPLLQPTSLSTQPAGLRNIECKQTNAARRMGSEKRADCGKRKWLSCRPPERRVAAWLAPKHAGLARRCRRPCPRLMTAPTYATLKGHAQRGVSGSCETHPVLMRDMREAVSTFAN